VRSEMMRSIYEIIHHCTANVDESEEWSSQYFFQLKQLERRRLKKSWSGLEDRKYRENADWLVVTSKVSLK